MPSPEDIQDQLTLLATYRRRLTERIKQRAGFGDLHTPPEVFEDIREAREGVAQIKTTLRGWGVPVEDLPGDHAQHAVSTSVARPRPRVFMSYKHDGMIDAPLAADLAAALRDTCEVFIDTELPIGARWAEQIKVELGRSDALIVLLSARAAESEMVRGEVTTAHTLGLAQGRPRILPVRVAYRAPFPYPLNEYLDPLHWAFWDGPTDTPALIAALRRALAGGGLPLQTYIEKNNVLANEGVAGGAPQSMAQLPGTKRTALPLEPPEGSMDADSQFYIARASDAPALAIAKANGRGATLTIKGSRQMGKSSLLMRVIDAADAAGKQVALLDFQFFDQAALREPDIFFRQFCAWLTDALELEDRTDEFWSAQLGNSQRCTRYVERHLLKMSDTPILLAMDEVESMFDAPFRSDFFGMLRGWHNNRAAKPAWRRLDLALVTSTEPYQLIANLNQSPFNVGQVVTLDDFTVDEVSELNELHGAPLDAAGVRQLYELLGGHPYLTRRALYQIASGRSTGAALFRDAAAERGPFGDHLRFHLFRMHGQPELVQGLQQVLQYGRCDDDTVFWRLQGAGLVRGEAASARARNHLYTAFFGTHLNVKPRM